MRYLKIVVGVAGLLLTVGWGMKVAPLLFAHKGPFAFAVFLVSLSCAIFTMILLSGFDERE